MSYVIATDEVGRGCIAGPVAACAVAFLSIECLVEQANESKITLKDSKKMRAKTREISKVWLYENLLSYHTEHVSVEVIDTHNILQASLLAMRIGIEKVIEAMQGEIPALIYVDGHINPYEPSNLKSGASRNARSLYDLVEVQIGGDNINPLISAASICAKQERDFAMLQLNELYPVYKWEQNKGYPTQQHISAIQLYGITRWHRKSFKPVSELI